MFLGLVVADGMPHVLLSDELVRFRDRNGDGLPDERETVLRGWDDPDLRTNKLSLMPEGLLNALDASEIKDLMTYLLTVP